ncbi:brain chitinase and chia [Planoprotostelium fungivorum]|uniref:Brain chitinase and chia n=1 Tax=Planoprotostelium fungivorum TaxID=1890364 RepID=A0A2P6N8M1_9EUKA|nr:brain chitinase and chia [Planoprotostelium fungivorum]
MSSSANTDKIWLVSGANRGIGFSLVQNLVTRPNVVVYAGARDPYKATELQKLAAEHQNLYIVKLTSGSIEEAKDAAAVIEKRSGGLDYVIANAGIGNSGHRLKDVPVEDINEHFQVNVVGVLVLFQAVLPLLLKRPTRVFEAIGSSVASNANAHQLKDIKNGSYSLSKAALNYLVKRISVEHADEGLIAFTVHPGLVETDLTRELLALPEVASWRSSAIKPDASAIAVLAITDRANKETNGKYLNVDGTELPCCSWYSEINVTGLTFARGMTSVGGIDCLGMESLSIHPKSLSGAEYRELTHSFGHLYTDMRSTCTLVLFSLLCLTTVTLGEKWFVGYWSADTASGLPAGCNIPPESIPADRYTHLIWSFATFNSTTGRIDPLDAGLARRFVAIKHRNPKIKLLASFGGAGLDPNEFTKLTSTKKVADTFILDSVRWCRQYGLDGIDIDWEYPSEQDVPYVVPFFRGLRVAYEAEAASTHRARLLLTSAAVAGDWELDYYQPSAIQNYVDFFNLMLYDFYGTWMTTTGPLAPLYGNASNDLDIHTCVGDYLRRNVSISKLVFGFPNYAATWTQPINANYLYAPSNGTGGTAGRCSGGSGQISATDLKEVLAKHHADVKWDDASKTPYLAYGDQFLSFENTRSIDLKLDYLIQAGFPGGMMWVVDPDTQVADQIWNRLKNARP